MATASEKLDNLSRGMAGLIERIERIEGCEAGSKCIVLGGSGSTGNGDVCRCHEDPRKMRVYTVLVDAFLRKASHVLWDDIA